MTTKMYSYKRERAKRLYPEPAIFNTVKGSVRSSVSSAINLGGPRPFAARAFADACYLEQECCKAGIC